MGGDLRGRLIFSHCFLLYSSCGFVFLLVWDLGSCTMWPTLRYFCFFSVSSVGGKKGTAFVDEYRSTLHRTHEFEWKWAGWRLRVFVCCFFLVPFYVLLCRCVTVGHSVGDS
ncbi:hypothetical protein FN846DRAFT_951998 [Sphaerosporella brunnea]|uniref:Uncharacterized protein n=1 Tax=Sphaerosporella brunnea TaxID=1250544 RepID=A0A5J5EV74_9PEZI|nr:hypothetical protein FN846DRAFT_951998 [Sphaerosporella brunnea]